MTIYKISANALERLASVVKFSTEEDLKTVRLENRSGQTFAIATNRKVASIENLGPTTEPDSAVHLKLSDELLALCLSGGILTFTIVPEALISMCQNDKGMVSDCCYWSTEGPLEKWRSWAHVDATKSAGVMHWDLFQIETLVSSSPSGKIYFPTFINAEKPVTIRDCTSDKWVGLFLPQPDTGEKNMSPAKLPEWWGK